MSVRKNALTQILLVVSLTVLFIYILSYVPPVRKWYARVLRISAPAYIPYVAPDSAFFKGYERMRGPYIHPFGSGSDIVVEKHKIDIDPETNMYRNETKGYMRVKDAKGGYTDFPVELHEKFLYDTSWRSTPGDQRVPLAATPKPITERAPDSVHLAGETEKAKLQAMMKKLRKVKLPYLYVTDSSHSMTIIHRKVFTKLRHDTIFLCTILTGTTPNPADKKLTIPVTLSTEEPVE